MTALWVAISVFGVATQSAVSYLRKPAWVNRDQALNENWKRIAVYSGVIGLLFTALATVLSLLNGLTAVIAPAVGVIAFVTFQSFLTDFRMRYVDRWIQYIAIVVSLIPAIYVVASFLPKYEQILFVVIFVVALAVTFAPGIGYADGLALQLLAVSIFPFYSVVGIQLALAGLLVAIFVYIIGHSLYKRTFNMRSLVKYSLPMVPLTLAPVLLILIIGLLVV